MDLFVIILNQKDTRFVNLEKLKELLKIKKKKSSYVAVLVNPDNGILEEIKDLTI